MFPYIWWILFYFKNVKICTYLYQLQCSFYTYLETFLFWFKICILPLHLMNFVSDTWTMLCTAHTSIFHFKNLSRSATRFFRSACVLSVVAAWAPPCLRILFQCQHDWAVTQIGVCMHNTSLATSSHLMLHNNTTTTHLILHNNTTSTHLMLHNINTPDAAQHQPTQLMLHNNTSDAAH